MGLIGTIKVMILYMGTYLDQVILVATLKGGILITINAEMSGFTTKKPTGAIKMNDEHLDYKLHRLKEGKSTCLEAGNWAYLDVNGGLHKIVNQGYYFQWKCDMWVHSYWHKGSWCAGVIGHSKAACISKINKESWPMWLEGFGKKLAWLEVTQ